MKYPALGRGDGPKPLLATNVDAHAPDASSMTASEQMFFLGAPLAHVVQFEERLRTMRLVKPPSRREATTRVRVLVVHA